MELPIWSGRRSVDLLLLTTAELRSAVLRLSFTAVSVWHVSSSHPHFAASVDGAVEVSAASTRYRGMCMSVEVFLVAGNASCMHAVSPGVCLPMQCRASSRDWLGMTCWHQHVSVPKCHLPCVVCLGAWVPLYVACQWCFTVSALRPTPLCYQSA
jgi:hypothetical protein